MEESRKTVRSFYIASFLNDLGSDMIYPVWPLFVTVVLGANMAFLGLLDGIGEALVSFSQAVSGVLSDRMQKRKIFIWTGYLCASLSRIGYGAATAPLHLLPFRVMDRLGKIREAPRDAMVADLASEKRRGSSFGMLRALDNLGAVCGILVCIVLFPHTGYRQLFSLAAIPSAIGALVILLMVRDMKKGNIFVNLSIRDLSPRLKLYFIASALFGLGSFSYSFLLLYATASGFSQGFVPVLYLLFTATASATSYPFGRLVDRMKNKFLLMGAFLLFGFMCSGFIFFRNGLILLFILYGLHKGVLVPVQKTIISSLAPPSRKASILGGYQMMLGFCSLFSSVLAGILWETYSMMAPFVFSVFTSLAASGVLLWVRDTG
jgi:MFS family permease